MDGSYFFNTGNLDHELKFGGSWREFEVESDFGWPGGRDLATFNGEVWGVDFNEYPRNTEVLQADRQGPAPTIQEYTAFWVQDTMTAGNLTLTGGLRFDIQKGENSAATVEAPAAEAAAESAEPEVIQRGKKEEAEES